MTRFFLLVTLIFLQSVFAFNEKSYHFFDPKPGEEQKDVSVIEQNKGWQSELVVQFQISEFKTDDLNIAPTRSTFQKLIFNELNLTHNEGEPELPFHSLLVLAAPEDIAVEIKERESHVISDILPAPSPIFPSRCSGKSEPQMVVEWSSYDKEMNTLYTIERMGDFQGQPVSRINFYPALFDGPAQRLTIYPHATFYITHKNEGKLDTLTSEASFLRYGNPVNNRYLILTPSRFVDAMKNWIDWKKKLGFEVVVYKTEDVGTTFTQLNNFFHRVYNDPNTTYGFALIVGDETIVPTDYRATSGSSKTPSDLTYFTTSGTGNYIPNVLAGRLVVTTTDDILHQTAKLIDYEKGLYGTVGGFTRGIGIASDEGSNPSDVEYIQSVNSYFENTYKTTFSNYFQVNSDSTPTNINKAFSDGVMWLTYLGHGSGTSWASIGSGSYSTTHIKSIGAGGVRPILIDVSCLNGRFKKGSLGERFMNEMNQNTPIGGAAYLGGSVSISWHPPAIMARGIAKGVAEDHPRYLGQAIMYGQFYMSQNWSRLSEVIDNYEWYHLFGDPSMIIRTTTPESLVVTKGMNTLTLKNSKGLPLSNIEVVLSKGSDVIRSYTDQNGVITSPDVGYSYAILDSRYLYTEGVL